MAIQIGGLATGLDTNALIEQLMSAQRRPIERLENEKKYLNSRLDAFKQFDSKLKDLLTKIEALDTAKEVSASKATLSSEGFFSVTADADALQANYSVEVISLARQEKEVAAGVADGWAASSSGSLVINGQTVNISAGNSLDAIRDAINGTADIGVTASIINDGSASPNRLVLTAAKSGADGVAIDAGSTFTDLTFSVSQAGSDARVLVDGIEISRDSNTISGAIPGVTLNLIKEGALLTAQDANGPGDPPRNLYESTTLSVAQDNAAVRKKIDDFVTAYNGIINFVKDQQDASWGSDARFMGAKRRIQGLISSVVGVSGDLKSLAQLGLETNKDGTLKANSSKLGTAISDNLDGVKALFSGEDGADGVAALFKSYLKGVTDSVGGYYAGSKKTTSSNIRRIDGSIAQQERRLEQRERNLRSQFEALETLVSGMNSQSNFLSQQLSMLGNMMGGN